jgi:hypothetical protein
MILLKNQTVRMNGPESEVKKSMGYKIASRIASFAGILSVTVWMFVLLKLAHYYQWFNKT